MHNVIALAAFLLLATPAVAADGIVNLKPLTQPLLEILGVFLSLGGIWLISMLRTKLAIDIDAKHEATLRAALESAVRFGMNKIDAAIADKPIAVNVGIPVLAQAINYVIDRVPDARKHFNLDDSRIAEMALARIPGIEGKFTAEDIQTAVRIARQLRA